MTRIIAFALLLFSAAGLQIASAAPDTVEMWGRHGCPYCAEARNYLLVVAHNASGSSRCRP